MSHYAERIEQAIPAEFHMISGSHDIQTSADVSNVSQFDLPDPAGKAGGACTSTLLQVLYKNGIATQNISWVECLRSRKYSQHHALLLGGLLLCWLTSIQSNGG